MSARPPIQPAALDREGAAAYLALSVSTFERLVREASMPQPRQLSGHRVAWIRSELDLWLLERPKSEQLPPHNTGTPKPRLKRGLSAANSSAIQPAPPGDQKAA